MTIEKTRERRARVREIAEVLRSDLYERGASHEHEDNETSATWWSPGGLSVTYGHDAEQRVWIRCRQANGEVYAETTDGDEMWLDSEML